jgi:predicted acyl esterase
LREQPFHLEEWLAHQRRDHYWRHGSICEDFSAVAVPALVIAGWADGYRNTPMKALAGVPQAKAIVGPWIHKYPHFAYPKPRLDFHAEAIRWWDRWLKGISNGAEELPRLRAYILDGARPALWRESDPGEWIAEASWPSPDIAEHVLRLGGGGSLGAVCDSDASLTIRSPQDCGTAAGEFFTLKPDAEMAGDQRVDDAGSLVFETTPLDQPLEILGFPTLRLRVAIDQPAANLCARLVDVHPDGIATRVSFGALNLAHRNGNAAPKAMIPGSMEDVDIMLDAAGYRFPAGHRIRLAISTAYWPMILPPPSTVTATIETGSCLLSLPSRAAGNQSRPDMPEPDNPDPLPRYREISPSVTKRCVKRDLTTGATRYLIHEDTGAAEHPGNLMISREVRDEEWTIKTDDPLSMTGTSRWTAELSRGAWSVRTRCEAAISCTAAEWLISASVAAYESDSMVHEKRWSRKIPRDLM